MVIGGSEREQTVNVTAGDELVELTAPGPVGGCAGIGCLVHDEVTLRVRGLRGLATLGDDGAMM
jgi:hypothetical protein